MLIFCVYIIDSNTICHAIQDLARDQNSRGRISHRVIARKEEKDVKRTRRWLSVVDAVISALCSMAAEDKQLLSCK